MFRLSVFQWLGLLPVGMELMPFGTLHQILRLILRDISKTCILGLHGVLRGSPLDLDTLFLTEYVYRGFGFCFNPAVKPSFGFFSHF